MNIRNKIFALALFALALASCSDDDRHADEPVVDDYRGSQSVLTLTDETASLSTSDIELIILTPDGSEITRRASHSRSGNRSTIRMDVGLREGNTDFSLPVTRIPRMLHALSSRLWNMDSEAESK